MSEREKILATEFSEGFVEAMRVRMMVSFYKYGPVSEAYPHRVDAIKSLKKRLEMYAKTGNTEYLVDAGNFAMIEFMHPSHPEAHFTPTDSDGSPGRTGRVSGKSTQYANTNIFIDPEQDAKRRAKAGTTPTTSQNEDSK